MSLIKHGIEEDQSNWRLHVSLETEQAFLFRTAEARAAIEQAQERHYKQFSASQPGTDGITGMGWCVPPEDLSSMRVREIPGYITAAARRLPNKARMAECVAEMMFAALEWELKAITDIKGQRAGYDYRMPNGEMLQVKYDRLAAQGLAIQTHEANPFHRY